MSHRYETVETLLAVLDEYDNEEFAKLFNEHDDLTELADDIAFIIISLASLISPVEIKRVRQKLLEEMVSHELEQFQLDLGLE